MTVDDSRMAAVTSFWEATGPTPGTFTTAGGRTVPYLLADQSIEIDDEPHILYGIQDLSAQRDLEGRLAQAQRLEAIGRLGGGVDHAVTNLLPAVIAAGECPAERSHCP